MFKRLKEEPHASNQRKGAIIHTSADPIFIEVGHTCHLVHCAADDALAGNSRDRLHQSHRISVLAIGEDGDAP